LPRLRLQAIRSCSPICIFGGSGGSSAAAIARDSQGNLYIAGTTSSVDLTILNGVQSQPGTAPLLATADSGKTWVYPLVGAANAYKWIAGAPGNPSLLYAATNLGAFRSTDFGVTWTAAANSGLGGALVQIAVDAGGSTLYAQTIQGSVLVSLDGGGTWSLSDLSHVVTLAAHASRPGRVFAATATPALFRSVDSGKTWTPLSTGAVQIAGPLALVSSPLSPHTLILVQNGGLLESVDDGDTWALLAQDQVVDDAESLAVDPANPANLYLATNAGIKASNDGGRSWRVVLPSASDLATYPPWKVAVDPRNSDRVYASGSHDLFVSTDAGRTWTRFTAPYPVNQVYLFVSPGDSRLMLTTIPNRDVFITKWDPTGEQLLYSTYLGGSDAEWATGIAVDSSGSAYVVGYTWSQNFPVTPGAFQTKLAGSRNAFIAKLSPDGSKLIYSTLLGGGGESTGGIAVDAAGSAVVTGSAGPGFPVTPNAFQRAPGGNCAFQVGPIWTGGDDAFVTKLSSDGGSLVYSTLLGGSCGESGYGVALNAGGDSWVVGQTVSRDFPVTRDALQPGFAGYGDGFLARFDGQGNLTHSTYLGGGGYATGVSAIALDASGNLFLTGLTTGFSQPASPGAVQAQAHGGCLILQFGPATLLSTGSAFVMKLDASARAVTGLTYLGSFCIAYATSIAVDPSGAPWITGTTGLPTPDPTAPSVPTVSPLRSERGAGFVSKFSADLKQLLFSTYFDTPNGLALDTSGVAYVIGAVTPTNSTVQEAYLARMYAAAMRRPPIKGH